MIIPFGKYKGQEVEVLAQSEKGRSYLKWVISQPVEENKFKEKNMERNRAWKKIIDSVESPEGSINTAIQEQLEQVTVAPQESINTLISTNQKTIVDKLDTIIQILSKSGQAWDE